jgi:hypothetical protein
MMLYIPRRTNHACAVAACLHRARTRDFLGVGLWLSALNVDTDARYTVPFLTQFWMFATPIAYPSSLLSEPWKALYGLDPMAGVIEGFRWALLGSAAPGPILIVSSLASVFVLMTGRFYSPDGEDLCGRCVARSFDLMSETVIDVSGLGKHDASAPGTAITHCGTALPIRRQLPFGRSGTPRRPVVRESTIRSFGP